MGPCASCYSQISGKSLATPPSVFCERLTFLYYGTLTVEFGGIICMHLATRPTSRLSKRSSRMVNYTVYSILEDTAIHCTYPGLYFEPRSSFDGLRNRPVKWDAVTAADVYHCYMMNDYTPYHISPTLQAASGRQEHALLMDL